MAFWAEPDNVQSGFTGVTAMMVRLYYCIAPAMQGQVGVVPPTGRTAVGTGKCAGPERLINFGIGFNLNVACSHNK
jgi:hypothetical protein